MTIALAAFLLVTPANAQDNMCGDYDALSRALSRAREQVLWRGMIGADTMVEVWVKSENPQSWTLLVRNTSGMACVRAMGDGWETLPIGERS